MTAMTTSTVRKNPDYTASSALPIKFSQELWRLLHDLHEAGRKKQEAEDYLRAQNPDIYSEIDSQEERISQLIDYIKQDVVKYGCYQDVEAGYYAIKQRKENVTYQPAAVRRDLPKFANAVIEEMVNKKAFEGLVKGGLVTPEQARACATVEESFAWIIRA